MDIQEIWNASKANTNHVPVINTISDIKNAGLNNPLRQAKKMLFKNMVFNVSISIMYIPIIIFYQYWQIQLFIGITLIFNLWGLNLTSTLYKNIEAEVTSNNLLMELKRVSATLKNWIKVQLKAALFVYPFSAAGGYFLGGVIGSGKSVDEFLQKKWTLVILFLLVAILTPVCYFLAKWMFKIAFGNIIKQIDKSIEELTHID